MLNTDLFFTELSMLNQNNYTFVEGKRIIEQAGYNDREIAKLMSYWNDLKVDEYMGDGGTYRFRRYSAFTLDMKELKLTLQPHSYYEQSGYVNKLNGNIKRYYEPLDIEFISNSIFLDIVYSLANLYSRIKEKTLIWDIKVHPYRILANQSTTGRPTPEGLHRDGVDFVSSMLIDRHNIVGGISTITNVKEEKILDIKMQNTLDIIIENDEKTLHQVSSISSEKSITGYRDVLVIAFTDKSKL